MTGSLRRLDPCFVLRRFPVWLPFAPRLACSCRQQLRLTRWKPKPLQPAAQSNLARPSPKSIPVTRLNTACPLMPPLRPCGLRRGLRVNMPHSPAGSIGVFCPPLGPPIARSCSPLLPNPNASSKSAIPTHCQTADPWSRVRTDGIARPLAVLQGFLVNCYQRFLGLVIVAMASIGDAPHG